MVTSEYIYQWYHYKGLMKKASGMVRCDKWDISRLFTPPPPIPLETLLNNLSRCIYNYKWRRTARICKQFFGKVCFFSFSSKLLSITQARVGQGKDRYCILNCTDIFSPLQGNFKGKLLQLLSVYWCISFTSSDAIRYNT